jgi:hypothetical protein
MNTSNASCRFCRNGTREKDKQAPALDPERMICCKCHACACDECFADRPIKKEVSL